MGLNHIYKVIWSKTKNAWVVVSEIAKRDGKSSVKSVVTSVAGKGIAATVVAMILCGGISSAASFATPGATAMGTDSVAIGDGSKATGVVSVAIGHGSSVTGPRSVSILGDTNGTQSISIRSSVDGSNSVGISSYSRGDNNIAIGGSIDEKSAFTVRTYQRTELVGTGSYNNSIAIGSDVVSSNTVVIGKTNQRKYDSKGLDFQTDESKLNKSDLIAPKAVKYYSMAGPIGTPEHLAGTGYIEGTLSNSVYLGNNSFAYTDDPDTDSETSFTGEKSLHTKSYDASNHVVVSNNTTGGAFGKVSKTSINGEEITGFAGAQSVGAVTIGAGDHERRIQNVAAGEVSATSTDAVNGSQVYAIADSLSKNMNTYMHVNDGSVTQNAGNANSNLGVLGSKGGATGKKSVAIGVDTQAAGENGVAVGNTAKATGKNSVAHGTDAEATEEDAIAIGNGAKAQGEKSISIGTGNIVKAAKSSVIGDPSHLDTSATGTHVQGNDNGTAAAPIMAKDSTFMGNNNLAGTAGTEGIHVVGNNNNIQSSNVMVLGNGITAGTGYDGAVILGNASATRAYTAPTNTTINGVTLDASKYAGTTAAGSTLSQGSIVSVGDAGKERQIKNVAAGEISATSTDAVTGSQLYGAVKALTESNTSPDVYVHVNDGTTTQKAGNATTNSGKADEKGGATGKDSIAIGKNTKAEGEKSVSIGSAVKSTKDYALTIGSLYANNTGEYGLAIASDTMNLSGNFAIGIGGGSVSGDNAISIGANYIAASRNIGIGDDIETSASAEGTIILGNFSTATSKMATVIGNNSSAGYIFEQRVGAEGITTDNANADNSVVIGNNLSATTKNTVIIGMNERKVGQNDRNQFVNPNKGTYTDNYGNPPVERYNEGTLENSVYLGHESYAFTDDATKDSPTSSSGEKSIHTKRYDTGTDTVITSTNTTGGAFGLVSKSTIDDTEFKNFAGEQSVGAVTIGGGGTERRIQNVAAGEMSATSTDAVNGSQLYSTAKTLLDGMTNYVHVNDGTTTQKAGTASSNKGILDAVGGATGKKSVAIGVDTQAAGENGVAVGNTAKATGKNSVAHGTDAEATEEDAIAIGNGAKAQGEKSISIGTGNIVKAAKSSVIGDPSHLDTSATGTHVQGNDNGTAAAPIMAKDSTFMGNNNLAGTAGTEGIHVVGNNNNIQSSNVMVLGNGITAGTGYDGAVILGNASATRAYTAPTNTTINGVTLDASKYAGTTAAGSTLSQGSIVSVGDAGKERQIKNVAAGEISATSTDAVTGSQLYGAVKALTESNTSPDVYVHVNDGTTTQKAGNATTNAGKADEMGGATGKNSIAIGHEAHAEDEDSISIGSVTHSAAGGVAIGVHSEAMGTNSLALSNGHAKGHYSIALVESEAKGDYSASIGAHSYSEGERSFSMGYFANTTKNAVDSISFGTNSSTAGKNSIAIGRGATAGYFMNFNQPGSDLGKQSTEDTTNTIAIGNQASATGKNSVVLGSYDMDYRVDNTQNADPTKLIAPAQFKDGYGDVYYHEGSLRNSVYLGHESYAVTDNPLVDNEDTSSGEKSIHTKRYDTTSKSVVTSANTTGGAFGLVSKSTIEGVEFKNFAAEQSVGAVTVGGGGTERRIQNVAAGEVSATSTDAVNGSQLHSVAKTILTTPIKMTGDSGDTIGLKLGKTVNIKGSVASGADVTDGNIAVVGDKATSTLSLKMAKNLTGLTSGTFIDASGNQTVINGAGVTVTPIGTGATSISITTSGINAGNQEIKGVKKGTTDDAAVNKKQMDDALAGISSTLTINDGTTDGSVNIKTGKLKVVGESGTNALVTTTVSGDTITVGTSTKLQNAVTAAENSANQDLSNLSTTGSGAIKTLAQDAVKVAGTGLATVSDATAAGVKTYTVNVDEGKLVIDDTTGKVGAAGSTQGTIVGKNGVATTQDVASVVNSAIDKTKQALDDAKHNFAGDDATVISRKHGEQLNIKGGASTTASDLTSGNIAVVGDTTSGTLNIEMAKALTGLTSATYTDTAGNTQTVTGGSSTISDAAGNSTVVSKGGVTTTDAAGNTTTTAPTGVTVTPTGAGATPISVTTSGISAGNKEIKNVANGTTDDAAVNKKQMDDALKGATDNTVSLGSESGSTTAKKLSTTGGITFNIKGETGANALITTSASGDDVAIAPTAKLTAAVTAAEKSADKDLSNLSAAGDTYIKNLAKSAASWSVETNGAGTTAVAGGDTVNFINGDNIAITNTGRSITIGTAKDVAFDKVTVGGTSGIVIDGTAKQIGGLAAATANDQAVNKGQMDTAIANAQTAATSTEKVVAKTLTGDTNLATVTGQTGTAKGETYEVAVSENAVKAVAQTAAQDAVKVTGTGLATVSDATAAGVKTYTVNVDEGKLVIDDTTGKLGATGASQGTVQGKDGVATTQDVASVVNSAIDKTKQALDDAKHNFAGDDATVISRKHGEQLNIKGGASTTATDLTSGNIAVVGDTTSGTLNIKMAKALTGLTSATYTDTAGNTQTVTGGSSTISDAAGNSTVVSKGGVTTTDAAGNTTTTAPTGVTVTPAGTGTTPISVTTSGISAGNKEIKNVANGTTDDAAVNKKQMDDALKGATDNTVSLGSESGSTTAKKLSTTGGITFNIKGETGANALITTSATGDDVTIAPTAKLTAAVTAAEKSADKDLSNLSAAGDTYIKNLAKSAASWNVETNGAGATAVAGGDTVNFINGDNIAITNTGRAITIGTAKNVSFDKVTVGGVVLDKTDGINAGNKEIKGVATGTAADSAVNKAQMDAAITAAASGSLSTETVEAGSTANGKLAAGDTNLATVSGLTGTAKGETYAVTVSGNAVKAVAQTAAQYAVKVAGTGLATVSDATAAGVKTYTVNVDEGKLVIDDTTGKLGATGATQGTVQGKNGVATTQDVASVVNSAIDKTKQALDDAEHKFDGDTGTTSVRKHGEVLSIKGGVTTPADLTTGNIGVVSDGAGTLNIRLAKALTGLTSATYTDAAGNTQTVTGGSSTITDGAGNTTSITKGGVTTTDGTNTTTVVPSGVTATNGTHTVTLGGSGINAGGTEIKNVGKATTDDAAVNKKQMDDAVKAATDSVSTLGDNKVSLGSDSGTTTAKKLSTTGGITFNIKGETGANALITTSATGDDVTIAPTAKLTAAVTAAEKSADKDLSNLSAAGDSYIKNLAKTAASWNVETNGAGTTAVAGGDTVNFINGDNIAITNTGRAITIGTAKNVAFDKVTVGGTSGIVIDGTAKQIGGLAAATANDQAVNKGQMDTAIANAQTAATSTEKVVAKTLTGDTNLATVTGQTGTAKGETYEVAVSENAVKAVAQTAAQDAVKVTGTGLATVTDSTTGGVKTYNVDVKTGNLVVNAAGQAGATGTTGAGGASGADGVATTQNVASAINDAITKSNANTAQALADAEHKFDGDTGTTSVRKHGEVLSIKGGVTTPADLTTGNIGVVSDGAGTLNIRLAKVLSGLTSASFTTAGGDTTMINGGGVTITPSATGATPISITTAGINAGNKEIKGIANGTTADAAVNKGQLDAAVLAAVGGALSIEKVEAGSVANGKLATGDTNLATVSGLTGATQNETYAVTVSENAVKAVAKTAAQDAVKVAGTGLATVSDATAAGVKTYTVNVDEGKLVIDDTTGKLGATGASQGATQGKNGVATTQDVASVVNSAIDKTKQALDDAKHNFAGDDATVISRKHGEQLNIKGGASTTATDLTSGNIAVVGDTTSGTLNIKLAKVLTGLTSATYTDAAGNTQTVTGGSSTITDGAGNTTTITKGGVTTTDGTNTTTVAPSGVTATNGTHTVTLGGSGINAGGTEIKNVGKATTDDAAVNKKQMDDAVKAATDSVSTLGDNKVSLGSDAGTTTAKKLSTTGGIKFNIKGDTGTNALITTSATGDDVTIAPTAKLTAAVTAAENAANKDLSNLNAAGDTYIKNLAKSAASWNVETNGTSTTAVAGGDTVNFINGDNIAITNTGRSITIGTAKNVAFDKVTVGGVVLDKTDGINAGGKEIKGIANGTTSDAAVNKGQLDAAVLAAAGGSLSTEKVVAKTLTGDTNLVTVTGQTGTAKGETYEVAVSENAVKAVAQTAAQDAVKVTGTGLATVTDSTTGSVKTYNVNVDEGKLVIDDTTGKLGATGASQGATQGKNGVATTQDVASVVNSAIDKTKQALDDAKHNFAGDDATVISRKHGEQLNIKGGASTTATDLTSGNIAVVGDTTSGTLNIKLAKVLTGLTSATYTDAAGNTQTVTGGSSTITDGAGNTTTITKGGVTTTDGTNTTTVAPSGVTATNGTHTVTLGGSGINAGGTEIKNIGKATTDDAAVNKKQMDDAVKAATDSVSTLGDNKVSLGSDAGTTTAKKLSTIGGIKFNIKGDTGTNALITTSATGDDVTIAPTAKLTAAVTAAEKSADKDLSNISTAGKTVIKNLAATSAQDAVKVTGTGLATVTDSTTGGVKTYNVDVTTGNLVVTATGQVGAAGTTGASGASGTNGVATTQNVASAINDAITKSNANTAQALADAEHKFDGDTGTTSVRKHGEVLSIKGGVTTPADLTTGNLGVVSDGAGTLNIRLAKVLSGLTSASFTTAGGDTTMINGGGVTITPSATGATPISITTAGINAGNKEIKGIANGTTADAAVNKGQLDAAVLAAAGGSLSTEKVVAKTLTGDTNLVTVTGQTGTAKGETYEVAVSENAVKAVAQTAAQDAVKVTGTGLATVTDSTTGGVKTYNVNVDEGKLVIDDTTGKLGATGATQGATQGKNGVATTQDVASVVNSAIDKTKQALDDAKHNFAGDDATVISRKHGEQLNIKGGASTTATDLTAGNIAVVGDTTTGTLNIKLAKVLTGLTSATYTDGAGNTQTVTGGSSTISDAAGNSTVVSKGGVTTTDGTNTTTVAPAGVTATDGTNTVKLTGSGIDAGNTQIKNVGKATTDDAAVNKKQMDDAVKAATDSISTLGDNKVSLGSDSGTTTAKKLSTTGGIKFNIKGDTGANALITTSATGDDVTIAPTAKLSAAVTAAENSANKDLSNLSTAGNTYIQNLAKSAASWNVETNGAGTTAVAGGDTVNFINGDNIAITNTGRSITISTAKNVSFDKVTVGGVVIDKNNGIDAGGKEITNVGPATSGNSAVNKTQMDTAITNAVNKATTDAKHDFGGDDTTVVTRKHGEKLNIKGGASTTAADLTSGNIAVLGDAATGTLNIRMAKALTGLSSATFTTPSGTTVINGGGMTITPSATGAAPISITTNGINAGNTEIKNVAAGTTANSAVNKQQMDSAISNATANVGFHTAGNTGTGSVSNGQTLTITGTNGIETNASGQSITVGLDAATRAQINNATTTANNAAKKDLSNIDNAGKQMIKDTAAWNVKVNSAAAETVKGGDTVTFNDGDNIKVTNTGKDITIATKKDVSFDKVTVGNVVIDKNTNRISGLANAVNNDEAVNLGQMNAAISTVTAGTNTIKYKANGGTQNSVALTTGFDFKGDSNIQITADPANSGIVNYKLNPALTGITSISGGTGAPTITLNAGSGSNPGNVSINSNLDMGGKQINNIGAATHAGDAVNKAQMDQALQNIAGASSNVAKSYAYKAGAGAAALAALKPIQYDPLEPTQIMAGIGNYKSQTAVALGVAHYTNENTMFNFGVSLDSHDGIVNAGVTHKFGYSPEKKAIPDRYKGGPISSIYVMQDEVTALQAIVQKQAAENEALRQQNEDMQRKVDMILSKIH